MSIPAKINRNGPIRRAVLIGLSLAAVCTPAAFASTAVGGGGLIAYWGDNGKSATLYTVNADGSNRRKITAGVSKFWAFSWSPDGTHIVFSRATGGIYVAAADGMGIRRLTGIPRNADAGDSSWSPDGTRIAFGMRYVGDMELYVIGVDGKGLRRLTAQYKNEYPSWSPDSRWILFERHRLSGLADAMVVRADGSGMHRIATIVTGTQCLCADWSPDGTKIAYEATTSRQSSRPEIFTMNADGTGRTRLTANSVRDEQPDWSPDGTRLAFYSERNGNGEIYVINADGTGLARVTHDPWYSAYPRWQPGG
jgi:Tol biopolymer transport system component